MCTSLTQAVVVCDDAAEEAFAKGSAGSAATALSILLADVSRRKDLKAF